MQKTKWIDLNDVIDELFVQLNWLVHILHMHIINKIELVKNIMHQHECCNETFFKEDCLPLQLGSCMQLEFEILICNLAELFARESMETFAEIESKAPKELCKVSPNRDKK